VIMVARAPVLGQLRPAAVLPGRAEGKGEPGPAPMPEPAAPKAPPPVPAAAAAAKGPRSVRAL
jgi:hypothetical protein